MVYGTEFWEAENARYVLKVSEIKVGGHVVIVFDVSKLNIKWR